MTVSTLVVPVGGYLVGSLPFSYWIARRRGVDVRSVGSGNVGATNVMRTAGRSAGVVAFVLDAGKGMLAGLVAHWIDPSGWLAPAAATCAVVGHMFSCWLGFRGGKGVATGFGAFVLLAPTAAVGALATFVLTLALARYVSLASIVAAFALALLVPLLGASSSCAAGAALVAGLIAWKHRTNILRLLRGVEPRVGSRPGAASQGHAS